MIATLLFAAAALAGPFGNKSKATITVQVTASVAAQEGVPV